MRGLELLLVVALAVPSASAQGGEAGDAAAVRREIEANEAAIGRGIRVRDYTALEKYWSPEMLVNAPENAIRGREAVMAAMKAGGLNYTSLKGTVESFKVFGDVAVEMGHEDFVMASGPAQGKPLQRRFTNVWQKTGGVWVQIARQATILGVDAGSVYGVKE